MRPRSAMVQRARLLRCRNLEVAGSSPAVGLFCFFYPPIRRPLFQFRKSSAHLPIFIFFFSCIFEKEMKFQAIDKVCNNVRFYVLKSNPEPLVNFKKAPRPSSIREMTKSPPRTQNMYLKQSTIHFFRLNEDGEWEKEPVHQSPKIWAGKDRNGLGQNAGIDMAGFCYLKKYNLRIKKSMKKKKAQGVWCTT